MNEMQQDTLRAEKRRELEQAIAIVRREDSDVGALLVHPDDIQRAFLGEDDMRAWCARRQLKLFVTRSQALGKFAFASASFDAADLAAIEQSGVQIDERMMEHPQERHLPSVPRYLQ